MAITFNQWYNEIVGDSASDEHTETDYIFNNGFV